MWSAVICVSEREINVRCAVVIEFSVSEVRSLFSVPNELPTISTTPVTSRRLTRREIVQSLLASMGALVLPQIASSHPVFRHLSDAETLAKADTRAAAAKWTPEFLDAHENQTLVLLSERIVPARLRLIALLTCCSLLTLPATGVSLPILFRPSMPNLVNGAAFHSNLSARIARTKSSQVWQLENPVLIRIQGEGL